MNRVVCLAILLVTGSQLYAQSIGERASVNSAPGVTPATADFVAEAPTSDVRSQIKPVGGDLGRSESIGVATTMVQDHTKPQAA